MAAALELRFLRDFLTGTFARVPHVYVPEYALIARSHINTLGLGVPPIEVIRIVAAADPARLML